MESKVQESLEIVATEIISQQINTQGKPLVELYKGDNVELREDGIYIIRKVDFSNRLPYVIKDVFESIKLQNSVS